MKTLLLTGTIQPFVQIVHCDPLIRLSEYTETIEKYIDYSDFESIVFAENSGFPFWEESRRLAEKARLKGKAFEYICIVDCDRRNLSTGEASLMKRAIETSALLQNTTYLWKSTGRIFVKNANLVTKFADFDKGYFLYSKQYDSLQTWFFGCSVSALGKLLSDEVIEDMATDCIEYAWMRFYRTHKEILKISRFCIFPDAVGINSSGKPYSVSRLKQLVRNILLFLGWYTVR